jgi:hypothetical protein
MRQALLLSLLLCAVEVTTADILPFEVNAALKSLSDGKVRNIVLENNATDWKDSKPDYYIRSFETPATCRGFELSEVEVREFFQYARVVLDVRKIVRKKGASRCTVKGYAETLDGSHIIWKIDRARNGMLYLSDDQNVELFCDKCQSNKFEPMESDSRPVIKHVTIKENSVQEQVIGSNISYDPDACKHFKLTKEKIRSFFKIARASARAEFNTTDTIGACHANGEATLQNGDKVIWKIHEDGRGMIDFPGDGTLLFFCNECFDTPVPRGVQ